MVYIWSSKIILTARHQQTGRDHQGVVPISRGWIPSSEIWEPTTSHWTKQSTWLRTVLCGGWCLHVALRTPSGACQKRRRRFTYSAVFSQILQKWPNARIIWAELKSGTFVLNDSKVFVLFVCNCVLVCSMLGVEHIWWTSGSHKPPRANSKGRQRCIVGTLDTTVFLDVCWRVSRICWVCIIMLLLSTMVVYRHHKIVANNYVCVH